MLVATRGGQPSTPFELEASCVEHWANFNLGMMSLRQNGSTKEIREEMKRVEDIVKGRSEQAELDMLLLWAKCKQSLKSFGEAGNIYNQVSGMLIDFFGLYCENLDILRSVHLSQICIRLLPFILGSLQR